VRVAVAVLRRGVADLLLSRRRTASACAHRPTLPPAAHSFNITAREHLFGSLSRAVRPLTRAAVERAALPAARRSLRALCLSLRRRAGTAAQRLDEGGLGTTERQVAADGRRAGG
jgi:hypothetical protein